MVGMDLKGLAAAAAILIAATGTARVASDMLSPPPAGTAVLAPKPFGKHCTVAAAKSGLQVTPRAGLPQPRAIAIAVTQKAPTTDAPVAGETAAAPLPPQSIEPDAGTLAVEARAVAARVSQKVPAALVPYFDTYIYVSKSAGGPYGQRLFLFRKTDGGTLALDESFRVSTGRERDEQYFTATPTGLFELDVHRFMPMARSAKWNDALMPWAMFLNYSYRTQMSGVALHAAVGRHEIADIGHRASGGCVRLPLEKADALFHRFLSEEQGRVPVFTFDPARGTTNTQGLVAHDAKGDILLADGIRVLVIIEDYPGESPSSTQS